MARERLDLSSTNKLIPYVAELAGQSDRACGIVAASMLETVLEQVLRKRFVEGKAEELFDVNGPLSSFSAKINIAAAMGIITKAEHRELHTVRKIRNDFAHNLNRSSFGVAPIKTHVAQLRLSRSKIIGEETRVRRDFEAAVMVLLGFLQGRLGKTRRIRMPNDHAQQLIDSCIHPTKPEKSASNK